jgi:hypothetical protein
MAPGRRRRRFPGAWSPGLTSVVAPGETDALLVPCGGGPLGGAWLRVPRPAPLEVDRGLEGIYVLDDSDDGRLAYVYVEHRL